MHTFHRTKSTLFGHVFKMACVSSQRHRIPHKYKIFKAHFYTDIQNVFSCTPLYKGFPPEQFSYYTNNSNEKNTVLRIRMIHKRICTTKHVHVNRETKILKRKCKRYENTQSAFFFRTTHLFYAVQLEIINTLISLALTQAWQKQTRDARYLSGTPIVC